MIQEVRIRFAGFGKEDDEWVNVKRYVRERSIPLEAAECHKVKVGDLVLCYQDRLDHSVYCDAHILRIEQRIHDIRGCRCLFFVHYDDDGSEEQVPLTRLCCRPN
uniref:SAWADEE domain-containing protein n=1 Tax=Kalanchoe fedtschenkoi TaxID=63787 RepID=A0A7N0TTQ5_KALFE